MKKLLGILCVFCITPVFAHQLKSFTEIYKSIKSGHNIRMVIDFDECVPRPKIANVIVYTAPTAVMMRKEYLQFANSPLTTNNPQFPKKPVLENCTYKITDNNEVNVMIRLIALPDYSVVSESNLTCSLGGAVKVFNK